MKFLTTASLFTGCTVAMTVDPVTEVYPVFDVTNFTASCNPHSSLCFYDFGVVKANNGETTPVKCSAAISAPSGHLPNVVEGQCDQSSRTFFVTRLFNESLYFTVSQPITPASNQTGYHTIEPAQIKIDQSYHVDYYSGPTDFSMFTPPL